MFDLKDIPEELHAFVERHLVPELDAMKARAEGVERWARAHAAYADSVLNAVETAAGVVDPAAAAAIKGAVSTAREFGTEAKRLLDEVLGKV